MSELILSLTDNQIAKIKKQANLLNSTPEEFIWKNIFPNEEFENSDNSLTVEMVIEEVKKLNKNDLFTLPSLYSLEKWRGFKNTRAIGRKFGQMAVNKNPDVFTFAEWCSEESAKSPYAVYKRK